MFSTATKDAANDTLQDAKSTASSAKRDLRDAGRDTSKNFNQYAEKAGHDLREFIDHTSDKIHHASDRVVGEIRTNPIRSSAMALGIGVLLGALIRR